MVLKLDMTEREAHDTVAVLEHENDIVRIVDPETRRILYWPAIDSGELVIPCKECNSVWGRDERCANCTSLEAVRAMQRTFKIEFNDNRAFWVQSRPMRVDGVPCVMEVVNDVTEGLMVEGGDRGAAADLVENMNRLLVTDPLTGLLNRRFLDNFARRFSEIEKKGVSVNVAMIDLDEMKVINDTYGHQAGDAVLKDIAGFLRLNYASNEGAAEQYAMRYGGDEFVVIDVGMDAEEFATDLQKRYESMRHVCIFGSKEIAFSLSIGTASSGEFGWDWDALLDAADKRMYAQKHVR